MRTNRFPCVMVCLAALLIASMAAGQTVPPGEQPGKPAGVNCTPEQVGGLLFNDVNLSFPTGRSCASCHEQSAGFADPNHEIPVSAGSFSDRFGNRNAPSVAYSSYSPTFHYDASSRTYVGGQCWDGRDATLADRARTPFLNPLEMNRHSVIDVVIRVKASSYSDQFKSVYGSHIFDNTEVAFAKIGDALAAYLRSSELNPFTSKYDEYLAGRANLNRQETLGLAIFEGKGGCSGCHPSARGAGGAPPLFTDFSYHNIGVPRNPTNPFFALQPVFNPDGDAWVDYGSGGVLKVTQELGKMKVPTLRNITLTAPYGHNGVFQSLRGVVEFCANRNVGYHLEPEVPQNVDTADFGNAGLRTGEIDALVAFLNTLADGYTQNPRKDPNIRPNDPPIDTDTPAIGRAVAISISPNPFNPVARIDYSVDGSTTVQLGVYDVSGRLVVRLVDENVAAGSHMATWDGKDARGASVASGIYFVRLNTGTQTLVKKAVLTR